jgi:hypothetical protein
VLGSSILCPAQLRSHDLPRQWLISDYEHLPDSAMRDILRAREPRFPRSDAPIALHFAITVAGTLQGPRHKAALVLVCAVAKPGL